VTATRCKHSNNNIKIYKWLHHGVRELDETLCKSDVLNSIFFFFYPFYIPGAYTNCRCGFHDDAGLCHARPNSIRPGRHDGSLQALCTTIVGTCQSHGFQETLSHSACEQQNHARDQGGKGTHYFAVDTPLCAGLRQPWQRAPFGIFVGGSRIMERPPRREPGVVQHQTRHQKKKKKKNHTDDGVGPGQLGLTRPWSRTTDPIALREGCLARLHDTRAAAVR
jgi:hypothetical protein